MKKSDILKMKSVAYYSGLDGLEIKGVEHGINDFIICVSDCWYGGESAKRPHRVKIYYDNNGGYFRVHGYKVPLCECIKMGV